MFYHFGRKKGSYTPLACEMKLKLSPFGKAKVCEINPTWIKNNKKNFKLLELLSNCLKMQNGHVFQIFCLPIIL